MRLFMTIPAFILAVSLFSCAQKKRGSSPDKNEVPVALQENKKSSGIFEIKKRAPEDLIEELYNQLKKEDTSLQRLSDNIELLHEQKQDSSEAFQNFDSKNDNYYDAANLHHNRIGDTALKARIKILIENSFKEYDHRASANEALLEVLTKREATLDDMEEALKIVKTLSMMEKYQNTNFPSASSLEAVVKEYDNAIEKANTLMKK